MYLSGVAVGRTKELHTLQLHCGLFPDPGSWLEMQSLRPYPWRSGSESALGQVLGDWCALTLYRVLRTTPAHTHMSAVVIL